MAARSVIEAGRLLLTLPELRAAEDKLRTRLEAKGIHYVIPAYGGSRTEADVNQLIMWRDQAVAKAIETAKRAGKSPTEIKRAGELAYYPVAPFSSGKHPKGGAFDIDIVKQPAGMTEAEAYGVAAQESRAIGLTPGYYWSGRQKDIYHHELPLSPDELAKRFAEWLRGRVLPRATVGAGAVIVGVAIVAALASRNGRRLGHA